MDILSPVLGSVTGFDAVQWKGIIWFAFKAILLCVPFIAVGILMERDVKRVSLPARLVKSVIVMLFAVPVIIFGAINYFAPGLPDAFWERYPFMEGFWLMEGRFAPMVLIVLALVFMVLYLTEAIGGDMTG